MGWNFHSPLLQKTYLLKLSIYSLMSLVIGISFKQKSHFSMVSMQKIEHFWHMAWRDRREERQGLKTVVRNEYNEKSVANIFLKKGNKFLMMV